MVRVAFPHGIPFVSTIPMIIRDGCHAAGTFQEVITGSPCSTPSVHRVPVSSRNSRPSAGLSCRSRDGVFALIPGVAF